MTQILDVFIAYLTGRAKSRVYKIFIAWMLVFHANIIFTSIFVDQDLIYKEHGLLKNEYVAREYFNLSSLTFWSDEIIKLSFAIGLTLLVIFVLPRKVTEPIYERELDSEYAMKIKKARKEALLEEEKKKIAEAERDIAEAEVDKQAAEVKKDKTLREIWDEEYEQFKHSHMHRDFSEVIDSIYEHNGNIKERDYRGNITFSLDSDLLAYVNSSDLVDIDQKEGLIAPTDKGKYFIKRYQVEN